MSTELWKFGKPHNDVFKRNTPDFPTNEEKYDKNSGLFGLIVNIL